MADDFKVYWQPGCSSCLRAKEFLATRGIAYESINVRARPEAMEELAQPRRPVDTGGGPGEPLRLRPGPG